MSETLDQLKPAVKDKNEEITISITQNYTNEERLNFERIIKSNLARINSRVFQIISRMNFSKR